ncbi:MULTISPECIES: efflux transporter outer membrane subunit [Asticcacaulis]|uniref:efflux transporter outer membrane subunit n=1 Tax=Asticcacaulis TaxID=76890 RepID=UPI001AE33A08|nr:MULTISPECIES: TolC family protein [Asticcacaulis]MBP2160423.1 NodT family efflux transporter outer membrane factor (OMF) lipoprotein [Asticcacaulis solisilvae]MDR6801468.1 NodT family efflux transporter outer membrane factor (OMF) lipoprotein [Asticcacaulis sp. BE141]
MRHLFIAASLAALIMAGGCASHPTAVPSASVTAAGPFQEFGNAISAAPVPGDWWRLFDDPVLNSHVERALAANTDIRAARANLEAARAAARQAQGAQGIATVLESGVGPDKANTQPSTSSVPKTSYEAGFTVAYEVDLFGRLRGATRAARADADAAQATLEAARVTVVADTVTAYVELCAASHDRALVQAQIDTAAQHRNLIATQLRLGEVSPLEVAQATAALETARAGLPGLEAERRRALYTLVALQGLPPAGAASLDSGCRTLPHIASPLPVGEGAALLARRPDVREAERKLAAAAARTDIATADLYPRIRLGASAGDIGGGFDAFLTPLITWNFPNQSVERAKIAAATGTADAALARFDGVILNALRETETALAAYQAEQRRRLSLQAALTEGDKAFTRAQSRWRLGEDSLLWVLDAQSARNAAERDLAASDLRLVRSQIALFKALGGGWQGVDENRGVK